MMHDENFLLGRWLSHPAPGEEVVITGASGRFPQCNNIHDLSENLLNKRDMIYKNSERWSVDHPEIPERSGPLPNLDKFDAGFFGVHQRQVKNMDPVIRKFMEVTAEAIIDAGVHPTDLANTKTGVFLGYSFNELIVSSLREITEQSSFAVTGSLKSMIVNRISYFLKLKGPSVVIDTACSSALVALNHAFVAIRSGQCDQALVGGAQLNTHPAVTLQFHRVGVLSNDGACKVFDQDAGGYVRAEAISCIFLQKAKNSKRIYAQIVHCKSNTDGFKDGGLLFPSSTGQGELLKEIYNESGLEPNQINYFEVHGTGTKVGDLQEIQAIDEIIGKHRDKPLWIGSVKSNLGHSEPASGVSSVIKVLLAMNTGFIGPNLHFKTPKNGMDALFQGRLVPVTEKVPLDENAIVGISNFGFGGSNSHVILRRCFKSKIEQDYTPKLICVSGRTKESVTKILEEGIQRKMDQEWIAMIHNLFEKEFSNHLYRGFLVNRENNEPIMSVQAYVKQFHPFYIKFGDFQQSYVRTLKNFSYIPIFNNKLQELQEIFKKNITDVNRNNAKNGNIFGGISVQLCIVEILKVLDLSPIVILDNYTRDMIETYPILAKTLQRLQVQTDFSDITSSGSVVLDLCDTNKALVEEPDNFFEFIGRLFEMGYNPQLSKMYQIKYPLDSTAPLISPLIKWNYKKTWPTSYFTSLEGVTQEIFEINLTEDEHKYITGHVIDGRNLFPATGYLYMVWQVLADKKLLRISNLPVVFTNCKFIRATTITKSQLAFNIIIQEASGNFEITVNETVVVTGQVTISDNIEKHQADFLEPKFKETNPKLLLDAHEIYTELNLRGYNYTGSFRGLNKCNVDATEGLLQWKNNWVTFMDNMLQMKILQMDTRLLYVPTGILKMVIDPVKHLEASDTASEETDLPVIANNKYNIIKSGGVEIHGLLATPISKKQPTEPILEKYEFVPNNTSLKLTQSIRINTQIILEDSLEDDIKAVEIVDEFTNTANHLYMPLMYNALESIPVVRPDLTISTNKCLEEIPGIKIEYVTLTPASNLLFIVASKILQRTEFLNQVLNALGKNGFVLSREEENFVPKDLNGITILTEHKLENETMILFKKSTNFENTFVEISSENFKWIPKLQKAIKQSSSVIVYSQNQQLDGILGFINCIRREPEGRKIKCFFISDKAPKFDPSNPFYSQQIDKNHPINVYKNSEWGTYRHLLLDEVSTKMNEHSRVVVVSKGDLSSMKWFEGDMKFDDKNKNILHTYYSAINFKDVMTATGRITVTLDRIRDQFLEGFEFSGRDVDGNRVMGMLSCGAFTNIITMDPYLCWPVPRDWSLEDAATVPCVYSTVLYALLIRTTLRPGTSILIHSATGGIGIAAVNVALYHGCKIFVTVGTQEKMDYLRANFPQIPNHHIGNSRDVSFENMIKKETNGVGVDIVLNSLSEEKLQASVRCLARGGKFMEIGKFDLMNNNAFSLLLLEKEASYHGIMLDDIFDGLREIKEQIGEELIRGIKTGYVKPLPRKVFSHEEIETAFRYMTQGKHIGKILIKIRGDEESQVIIKPSMKLMESFPRFYCDSEKSYIILGGLGGFGLELADWLVLRGARKLILTSRSGVQNGHQSQRIRLWTSYGVHVKISTSISTKEECINLLQEANQTGEIDGIFNLAVVLDDALFEDQTENHFNVSLMPKAQATIFLDEITRERCPNLRYFVVFSSVSCGRGNAGQTNYGMANSVMERICERRKLDGLPGLAIQWGAVGDVGLVAKMQKDNKELVIGGTLQQKISSCLNVMDRFLKQNNPVVASMVVAEKRDKTCGGTPLDAVAKIIGVKNMKSVSYQATLAELGMDSIMATEVIQVLEKDFGIYTNSKEVRNLTLSKLMDMQSETQTEDQNSKKNLEGTNILLQHLPSCETMNTPFVELGSAKQNKTVTVFVFPGIEGVFTSLELIANNLDAKVLGVQYNYIKPESDIHSICGKILPHIERNISKNEPFCFVGYSFGVIVALEVASLLENKNYLGKVAAVDGSPDHLLQILEQYSPSNKDEELETVLLCNMIGLFAPVEVLNNHKDQLLHCQNFDQRVELALSLMPSELVQRHKIEKANGIIFYERCKSVKSYKFSKEKLKSSIKLYKAGYSIIQNVEHDYGLSKHFSTAVDVMTIEGNHETMLAQSVLVEDISKFF